MLISELGEFALIKRLSRSIKTDSTVVKGSGDDCAVIKFNQKNYLLFSCDMLLEGVDFKPNENPYLIGRKSLAVSISDIAACAGLPRYCLIALGIPKNKSVEFVEQLFKGISFMAKKFKINIVGGDLSKAKKLTIDISMLGIVKKRELVLRSGAKIGDIIFVTGELGGSIYGKHLRFIPRIKEAVILVKNFKLNSMIDISDGLAQDLGHILEESKKGAVIYEDLIPISKKARGLTDALYMGEDFELLFSLSPKEAKKLLNKGLKNSKPIGEIVDKVYGLKLIGKDGRERNLKLKGYRHF